MSQIGNQYSVWYENFINVRTSTIVITVVMPLALTPIITDILLSLSRLNRCGLLILILRLILERRLWILGNNNIWIRII